MHRESIEEPSSSLAIMKFISVISIFLLTYICGVLPYKWTNFTYLSYANVFSGGLFLSMALIHLLPEASLTFTYNQGLENIQQIKVYNSEGQYYGDPKIVEIDGIKYAIENTSCQSNNYFPFPWAFTICIMTIGFCLFIEKVAFANVYTHSHSITKKNPTRRLSEGDGEKEMELINHSEHHLIEKGSFKEDPPENFSPILVLCALTIHSIFESLALGIILDLTFFVNLYIAIMLHKWAESLSLAITFLNNKFDAQKAQRYILFFSLTAPCGIVCGWILSYMSKILAAIFFSISSGTFIYITLMEVLPDEFEIVEDRKNKLLKFLLLIVAFVIITGIWFIEA